MEGDEGELGFVGLPGLLGLVGEAGLLGDEGELGFVGDPGLLGFVGEAGEEGLDKAGAGVVFERLDGLGDIVEELETKFCNSNQRSHKASL